MKPDWQREQNDWWMRDFTTLPDPRGLNERALRGVWQTAPYVTAGFSGTMVLANPYAQAPALKVPLPVTGRYSIAVGMTENYSDRLLIKLERDRCFDKLAHGDIAPTEGNFLQECWWKDGDLVAGDTLVLQQDAGMNRRCAVGYVRVYPALPATKPEIPLVATMDGFPGNNGPLPLDEMIGEELVFTDTHVMELCHGTDICGSAQYNTALPAHRYPADRYEHEELISADYYPWVIGQLLKFERAGRCTLRESIAAAHGIGRKLYAYHRMGITRIYAPMDMFACPLFDEHPEWRCIDWDGTPISRLSIAYPGVRQFFLEHLRETVERGADGVCLTFSRGWPLILFEKPVADEFQRRTGQEMKSAEEEDPVLLQVQIDIFNQFLRDIRKTVREAGGKRDTKVVTLNLALPEINRQFAMDCETWAREGLVDLFCPYPYGEVAKPKAIEVPKWRAILKGTGARLCPIFNRMTYEPAGIIETPVALLDRAEKWLGEGVDGLAVWDWDGYMAMPVFRRFAYNLGSKEGRARLRKLFAAGTIRYQIKTFDGITVDRYHPGWNV